MCCELEADSAGLLLVVCAMIWPPGVPCHRKAAMTSLALPLHQHSHVNWSRTGQNICTWQQRFAGLLQHAA